MTCTLWPPSLSPRKRDWTEPPRIIKNVFAVLCWRPGVTLGNTSPDPAGAPDAIRGRGGLAPRGPGQRKGAAQTAPSSPAPAAPLPGPHLPGRWLVASALDFDPLALQLASLRPREGVLGSKPTSLAGGGGSCSRRGKEVCGGGLWAHPGLGDALPTPAPTPAGWCHQ